SAVVSSAFSQSLMVVPLRWSCEPPVIQSPEMFDLGGGSPARWAATGSWAASGQATCHGGKAHPHEWQPGNTKGYVTWPPNRIARGGDGLWHLGASHEMPGGARDRGLWGGDGVYQERLMPSVDDCVRQERLMPSVGDGLCQERLMPSR